MSATSSLTVPCTVLVVDDMPGVGTFICAALRRLGCQALQADSPSEALRIATAHSEPIRLLIADFDLPEMTGGELVRQLRVAQPDLRVLFISGHCRDTLVDRGVLDPDSPFLQKPFTIERLRAKMHEFLEA